MRSVSTSMMTAAPVLSKMAFSVWVSVIFSASCDPSTWTLRHTRATGRFTLSSTRLTNPL